MPFSLKNVLQDSLGTFLKVLPASTAAQATDTSISVQISPNSPGLPLASGASTSANQDTGNASLASIDAKTPALVSGRQPVDGSAVTQPVSAASLPLPSGAATAALQTSILNAIQAMVDLETSLWTDDTHAFFVRRESVNEGTGVITITFTDPSGSVVTPGAGLRPLVAGTSHIVENSTYNATTAGTGYSVGDFLIHSVIIDTAASPPSAVASFWLNATTGSVISAPNPAHLTNGLATLLTSILTALTNGTQRTIVDSITTFTGLTDTQLRASAVPVSAASLPLPSGAATESTLAAASAKLPATLGQAAMAASLAVVVSPDQSAIPVSQSGTWTVQPGNTPNTTAWLVTQAASSAADALPTLGTARSITTSGTSASQALSTSGFKAVRLTARNSSLYFTIANSSATATSSSHWLPAGGSIDLRIDLTAMPAPVVAAIRDTSNGSLSITELA